MRSIGIRDLKSHASRVLRRVRENGEEIEVTYRGRPVARLIPISGAGRTAKKAAAVWADLNRLAAEIGARWPARAKVVDAVREVRREL
jgi:prevent-host-death family protein